MAKKYSIADARTNLPAIVDAVEAGGEVELTRRGRPVAVVISRHAYARLRSQQGGFGDRYRAFLRRFSLDEVGVPDGFFDDLREPGTGRNVKL